MTNREIAKKLQISPASLSLILNNKPGISQATRERVLWELREMGYAHLIKPIRQPVPCTDDLYFIVYLRSGYVMGYSPFVYLLTENVEKQAKKYGFNVLLKPMDGRADLEKEIEAINQSGAQGVLIMATEMLDEDIAHFSRLDVPYVAIDHDFTALNVNTVAINNQMGTYQAVEYLVRMGHTDIGYVHTTEYISSWSERAYGYRQALAQFRLPLSDDKLYRARYNGGYSYEDFKQIIASGSRLPTALVTDDDVIAVGVMRALQEAGYRIPEDISIIGFNDRPVCELITPKLTSIDVPKEDFGTEALEFLVSLIEKKRDNRLPERAVKRRITTRLVERQSVCRL